MISDALNQPKQRVKEEKCHETRKILNRKKMLLRWFFMTILGVSIDERAGFFEIEPIAHDQPAIKVAGWSSPVARWAHNPKVGGSNPPPATKCKRRT